MDNINESTPIAALSIGQFKELLTEMSISLGFSASAHNAGANSAKNYIYGLRGIQRLFSVSHKTAQAYKDTFLQPAVKQNGRKIVVDADLAMDLFNRRNER